MSSHADEGLLLSVLVYVAAVLGVLALFVMPVVWANGPTVMENTGADHARELLAARRSSSAYPVAKLAPAELLPAGVVELAARADKAARAKRQAALARQDRLAEQRQDHLAQQRGAARGARLAQRARAQGGRSYARLPRHPRSSGALAAQY